MITVFGHIIREIYFNTCIFTTPSQLDKVARFRQGKVIILVINKYEVQLEYCKFVCYYRENVFIKQITTHHVVLQYVQGQSSYSLLNIALYVKLLHCCIYFRLNFIFDFSNVVLEKLPSRFNFIISLNVRSLLFLIE